MVEIAKTINLVGRYLRRVIALPQGSNSKDLA
jgi:hypothetical protein